MNEDILAGQRYENPGYFEGGLHTYYISVSEGSFLSYGGVGNDRRDEFLEWSERNATVTASTSSTRSL